MKMSFPSDPDSSCKTQQNYNVKEKLQYIQFKTEDSNHMQRDLSTTKTVTLSHHALGTSQ